jgi:rRNA maturation RNase YbeY
MPEDSKISFHYVDVSFPFSQRKKLKTFLLKLIKEQGRKVDHINYIFCSDKYLLELNKQYLDHNTLTDIITFELSAPAASIVSDIYISIERVKENAIVFATPFYRELHRVIFHGALHLCGYNDKSKADATRMRAAEEKCLDRYFR